MPPQFQASDNGNVTGATRSSVIQRVITALQAGDVVGSGARYVRSLVGGLAAGVAGQIFAAANYVYTGLRDLATTHPDTQIPQALHIERTLLPVPYQYSIDASFINPQTGQPETRRQYIDSQTQLSISQLSDISRSILEGTSEQRRYARYESVEGSIDIVAVTVIRAYCQSC